MNWMEALLKTYDSCIRDPTTIHEDVPLVPIFHTTSQAHLEVRIDGDGNFIGAEAIPKEMQTTVIPCTEASGGRTSAPSPHPLCDKLVYLAGDLMEHSEADRVSFPKAHMMYLELLRKWCDSPNGTDATRSVLKYVGKGTMVFDLISSGVMVADGSGKLCTKEDAPDAPLFAVSKISDFQESAFVRWVVLDGGIEPRVWENETVRESWTMYCTSNMGNVGLCYLTGEEVPLTQNHPSKIRNAGDKAKILSSNDKSGFLFRGRFENADQAYGVGYESSQKVHSALRWLIGRQGYREGDLCIVSWTLDGDEVRSPVQDFSDFLEIDADEANTGQISAKALNKRIAGYNSRIIDKDVMLMAMDSTEENQGRLSIIMYREYLGGDFIERLDGWHTRCAWIHDYIKVKDEDGEDRKVVFVGAPAPRDIAKAAYGEKADSKIVSHAVRRILPCILDGTHIPRDITDSVVRRASNPVSMEEWERKKTLSIACSVFNESVGGRYEMVLEKDRKSRDYLYGRLLAIADLMEGAALKEAGESRQTTAIRLMQRFSEFPYATWRDIELALVPYMARLGPKANYYRSRISEVMDMFEGDDYRNNQRLSGEFLLAYHCQIADHYRKKEDNDEKEE